MDDNGDVEFNMTLLEFFKTESGGHGKTSCTLRKKKNEYHSSLDIVPSVGYVFNAVLYIYLKPDS